MKVVALILAFCMHTMVLLSQEFKEVTKELAFDELSKVSKNYNGDLYSLSYAKRMFKNAADASPFQESTGTIYKGVGYEYRVEEPGSLVIQNQDYKLVVDSTIHLVTFNVKDSLFKAVNLDQMMRSDMVSLYTFQRKENKQTVSYRIIPNNGIGSTSEVSFDKQNFLLTTITMIFPLGNYFQDQLEDETEEQPIVIVSYNKPEKLNKQSNRFNFSNWLTLEKDTPKLLENQAKFELHDQRYKPSKN